MSNPVHHVKISNHSGTTSIAKRNLEWCLKAIMMHRNHPYKLIIKAEFSENVLFLGCV